MANFNPTASVTAVARTVPATVADPQQGLQSISPGSVAGASQPTPLAPRPAAAATWANHVTGLSGLIVLGLLCVRLYRGGLPVQTDYPHATTVLLDAGSRILDGQVPYQDFHTPIGFAYLGLVAGFMRLAHGLPHGLAMLSAACGFAVGVWTWFLARARCSAPITAVITLLAGLLVATPAFFALGPATVTYGGHYSRLAWGLLLSVIVQAALPLGAAFSPAVREERRDAVAASLPHASTRGAIFRTLVEGLGLGACLGLLFGTKFTFCFAAIIIVAAAWWYRRPDVRLLLAIPVGAVLAILAGLHASGATLAGYLHDCASLGGAVPLPVLLMEYRRKLDFISLALVAALAWWSWPAHRRGWQPGWRQPLPEHILLAGLTLALGLVLSATTGIEDASPCYLFSLVILALGSSTPASAAVTMPTRAGERRLGAQLVAVAACLAFALRIALPIVAGPYAAASHSLTLAQGPWRGLDFLPNVPGASDREHAIAQVWIQPHNLVDNLWYLYLADGEGILRPRMAAGERVLSMDYVNPFPYLLESPAPRGDLLYWSFDRNVTVKSAPAPERLFADADWVMVPKIEIFHDSAKQKIALYLPWITAHGHLEATSEWWDCYRISRAAMSARR